MSRKPRVHEPKRDQGEIRFEIPDDVLPPDHRARLLWEVLGRLDLSAFLDGAKAVEGRAGRTIQSPRMKLTLWCYAISCGIGSAREIERRTETDLAFRWITGERKVSRQTLSNFRNDHSDALQKAFTDVLGVLLHEGLLSLDTVGVDGMRVRASASAPSFRSRSTLEEMKEQAELHLKAVLAQAADPALSRREKAAREQKAREFQERVEAAIGTIQELEERRKPPKTPRASTTDAEARVMKMANGGFRPGFNVQLATAGDPVSGPRTIVGVRVTNVGSDMQTLQPIVEQIGERTGVLPKAVLADANHANHAHIEALELQGVKNYIPPNYRSKTRKPRSDRTLTPAVQGWLARMETPEALQIFRGRPSLAELPNAAFRSRYGMQQFLVRGVDKATTVSLLTALTHNLVTHAPKLLA